MVRGEAESTCSGSTHRNQTGKPVKAIALSERVIRMRTVAAPGGGGGGSLLNSGAAARAASQIIVRSCVVVIARIVARYSFPDSSVSGSSSANCPNIAYVGCDASSVYAPGAMLSNWNLPDESTSVEKGVPESPTTVPRSGI